MRKCVHFYIDGEWIRPIVPKNIEIIDPATETATGQLSMGSESDIDKAVKAARKAFQLYSQTSVAERIELFENIIVEFKRRADDLAEAVTMEMGAPRELAEKLQVGLALKHLYVTLDVLRDYKFQITHGTTMVIKEPIGVCGLITPWNFPLTQIICKVAPALATGCTMILKPSEIAPYSASIFTEILHAASVPKGVFNLVNGDGPNVGAALARHPDIDMISITGSTRAGIEVAVDAAVTVKRVHQELGGKSPNIVLLGADLQRAVASGVRSAMLNSGQVCVAPTRMLVPNSLMDEVLTIAKTATKKITVGHPASGATIGPVASAAQWNKIQTLINIGIEEGAMVIAGGPGKPEGLDKGFYVKPTVLANVHNDMRVAREEIFGPVLTILGYDTLDEAVAIANDTPYGLAAYVSGASVEDAGKVAAKLRAGQVTINGAAPDFTSPFGGVKQSGNGREWGEYGLADFLEVKSILGFSPKKKQP